MSDTLPISCVSCRKRKIKCNKKKPCDQCLKRKVDCEFPATFRNIKIGEDGTKEGRVTTSEKVKIELHGGELQLDKNSELLQQQQAQLQLNQEQINLQQQQLHNQHLQNTILEQQSQQRNEALPPRIPLQTLTESGSAKSSSGASSNSLLTSTSAQSSLATDPPSVSDSTGTETAAKIISRDVKFNNISGQSGESGSEYSGDLTRVHPYPRQMVSGDLNDMALMKENFDMMRAANSQLLDENRALTQRLEEILLKISVSDTTPGSTSSSSSSAAPGSASTNATGGPQVKKTSSASTTTTNSSTKRDRSADSSSEDLPNKKEKVGFFGHSKASFPNDSASANQGMYSTNVPGVGTVPPKESSSSGGSSGDEVGQQVNSADMQSGAGDAKATPPTRKLHKLKRNKSGGSDGSNNWELDNDAFQTHESVKSNRMVERSGKKKKLPILPSYLLKYEDPDISTDSDTNRDVFRLNFEVIMNLVYKFFERSPYYRTFISASHVFGFLKTYGNINDRDWDNDDDMMLIYMILSLSVQRLSSKDFVDLNLLPAGSVNTCTKYRKYLTRNVLHKGFERLKHGLVKESLLSIQSYILCTEWYFLEQKYEECWTMMFHACSISYSIGLHIMGNYSLQEVKPGKQFKNLISATAEDSDVSDKKESSGSEEDDKGQDEGLDVTRYRLWFALKYYVSLICSIFGRPNPISVQVGMNGSNSGLGSDIPNEKAHILFKVGVCESLRLSNLMLIENFMIDFTLPDLLDLSHKFDREIAILNRAYASLVNGNSVDGVVPAPSNDLDYLVIDDFTGKPLQLTRLELLADLIILHINNAKLYEPFISKFENMKGYDQIVKDQTESVSRFLLLLNTFIEGFLKHCVDEHFHEGQISGADSNDESLNYGPVKFGKLFKSYFPFLNSFICQGVIVVFTLLHYKSKDFVANNDKSVLNNSFLNLVESNLNSLINFEQRMSTKYITTSRMWSSNMVYLINRVLNLIKLLYEKQEDSSIAEEVRKQKQYAGTSSSSPDSNSNLPITTARGNLSYLLNTNPFGDPSQFEYLNGFHLNDPFWLTVPDGGAMQYYVEEDARPNKSIAGFKQYAPMNDQDSASNSDDKRQNSTTSMATSGDSISATPSGQAPVPGTNNRPMISRPPSDLFGLNSNFSNWNDVGNMQGMRQTPNNGGGNSAVGTPNIGTGLTFGGRRPMSSSLPPPIPTPSLQQQQQQQQLPSLSQLQQQQQQQQQQQGPKEQQPAPPSQPTPQHPTPNFMGGGYMFPQPLGYTPQPFPNDQTYYSQGDKPQPYQDKN